MAAALGMEYDPYQMAVPTLILAAEENDVITPEGVKGLFDAVGADRVSALRTGAGHGEMLYCGDGYVTAWFMWHLQDDGVAAGAFTGEGAELRNNPLYRDVRIGLS